MPSLRIAQLMASGPVVGGLEKHFVELCTGLAQEHEVLAIADPMHAAALPSSVEFCPFDFRGSRRNPLTLMRVHRLLRSFQPDVIHAQANKAAEIVATLRHFQPARRIATVHGFKSNNRVFSRFDAVICVSRAIMDRVRLPQCELIPNGIRPLQLPPRDERFFGKVLGLPTTRQVVIAAGRLAPIKGYAGLIRAWQGIDADLVIAGEGPQRSELEAIIARLGLTDSVHLVGFRTDVPTLMAQADLLVIASEREGFPYAMVEGLHLEQVIVSTRFPGAEDFLPERFMATYGDESALHALVAKTLSELDSARSTYRPVWDRARKELTIDNMVQQTGRVYQQLLLQAA